MIGDWDGSREYWHPDALPPSATWPGDAVVSDDAADLPLVRRARDAGYELLTEAPLWCFLPALWPAGDRVWVHDQRVRHASRYSADRGSERVPWTTADHFAIEADYARVIADCGVAPRPPGRVWLLRTPAGRGTLDEFLLGVSRSWGRRGGEILADAAFAANAADEVARLFGLGAHRDEEP